MTLISIGIDDVDSRFGGCTTHFAGILLKLVSARAILADYPLLVRLNPAIPWKTRGNAAVVIRLLYDEDPKSLLEDVYGLASDYALEDTPSPGKAPGVVVHVGRPWKPRLRVLYNKALTDVVTKDLVERVMEKEGMMWRGGRGVIGAASAIGALAPHDDYSFELIAYRRPELMGRERCIDYSKMISIEARTRPCTYNNIDFEEKSVAAAPRGPDPVLAGFRGDCPEELPKFLDALCEEPHFWIVYRSNQHTDIHAQPLSALEPYRTGSIKLVVAEKPRVIAGGHTIVAGKTPGNQLVELAFYRETNPLNMVARKLIPGDVVRVVGSVKPYKPGNVPVIAVQKLSILELSTHYTKVAPICPRCGHRMKSKGSGIDWCPRCGYRSPKKRAVITHKRNLLPSTYTPREGRIPHLVRPLTKKRQNPFQSKAIGSIIPAKTTNILYNSK